MNRHARTYVNHDAEMWGAEAAAFVPFGAQRRAAGEGRLAPRRRATSLPRRASSTATCPSCRRFRDGWRCAGSRGAGTPSSKGVAAAEQTRVDSGLQEAPTPAWAIGNLRAGVELGRFWLIGGVENLFDRTYREHLSYQRDPFRAGVAVPEPGRSFSVALRYRI